MQIRKELIKRDICGDTILVPVGKTVYDASGLFVLNELGSFIWDVLPAAETETDITDRVLAEYEIDRQTAEADVRAFLEKLRELSIL